MLSLSLAHAHTHTEVREASQRYELFIVCVFWLHSDDGDEEADGVVVNEPRSVWIAERAGQLHVSGCPNQTVFTRELASDMRDKLEAAAAAADKTVSARGCGALAWYDRAVRLTLGVCSWCGQ